MIICGMIWIKLILRARLKFSRPLNTNTESQRYPPQKRICINMLNLLAVEVNFIGTKSTGNQRVYQQYSTNGKSAKTNYPNTSIKWSHELAGYKKNHAVFPKDEKCQNILNLMSNPGFLQKMISFKAFHCFIFSKPQLIINICKTLVAIFSSLPELSCISAWE